MCAPRLNELRIAPEHALSAGTSPQQSCARYNGGLMPQALKCAEAAHQTLCFLRGRNNGLDGLPPWKLCSARVSTRVLSVRNLSFELLYTCLPLSHAFCTPLRLPAQRAPRQGPPDAGVLWPG